MYRIMIVDDEQRILDGMKRHLEKGNYGFAQIQTASDARTALSLIEKNAAPHILITDICMPGMSGVDLLKTLRSRGIASRVIVLSGYNDFEYVRAMAVLGIENYLLKPVNEEELSQTLEDTIRKLKKEEKEQNASLLHADLIRENIINRWIYGSIGEKELQERADFLALNLEAAYFVPCILRVLGTRESKDRELKQQIYDLCRARISRQPDCYCSRSYNGDTLALFCLEEEDLADALPARILNCCLEEIRETLHVKPYLLMGKPADGYWNVASRFQEALGNGIYLDTLPLWDSPAQETGQEEAASPFSYHLAEYVLAHYPEDLSLKTLAAHFKGNAAYIGRIFKRDMHQTFHEYLKQVRLEKAKELLVHSDASAKEIAEKVGFQNATYFCTVFRKETGLSPAEYRRQLGL